MNDQIKILIVAHKNYNFPQNDIYIPIQVGSILKYQKFTKLNDSQGNHISDKNGSFCELTALYWAWKNNFFNQLDYVGLVHYRRYFKGDSISLMKKKIIGKEESLSFLSQYDAIVAKKRNYYIETIYSHYKNAHYIQDLDETRNIIATKHPGYLTAFDQVMNGKKLHLYNMFIMKKELLESYCDWLFSILFSLEKKIDISDYDNYQKRVFGFIAERLFNVWLYHNKIKVKELSVVNIECENLFLKVINLLKRKYFCKV